MSRAVPNVSGFCFCGCGRKTSTAKAGEFTRGYLKGEHRYYLSGHSNPAPDFWGKVFRKGPEECWEWQGSTSKYGYGQIRMNGVLVGAHRYAWEMKHGRPAGSFDVCHRCDNPACVNPSHLFLGTHQENMEDCAAKGRTTRGERNAQAKLSAADVRQMHVLSSAGVSQPLIAKRFGVSSSHVCTILSGKRWGHIASEVAGAR